MLDCCHSGDGTRDAFVTVRQWNPASARDADAAVQTAIDKLKGPRPLDGFLDGTLQHFQKRTSTGHVALTACQSSELAKELIVGDEHRGAFTATMIEVLETVGSKADYRSVVAAVRSRLERTVERQRPSVYPIDAGGLGDGLFLDGTIEPAPPSFLMTKSESGWSVDAGAVHGLRAPADGEEFRFACLQPDGTPCGQVRVVSVETGRAAVEPIGWEPADTAYRAVISWVPLPTATVTFDPADGEAAAGVYEQVRQKLASSGPSGTPSPYVRERVAGSSSAGLVLRVRFEDDQPGGPCVRGAAGRWLTCHPHRGVGDCLRRSGTRRRDGGAAVGARGTLGAAPRAGQPPFGARRCGAAAGSTQPAQARWPCRPIGNRSDSPASTPSRTRTNGEPPNVFMHLKNTSDRDLHVALLDLTDRLECDVLYQTKTLAAGTEDNVNSKGGPMKLSLSRGVDPVPGARTQDWLKIIVSESPFEANAFELAAVGEQATIERHVAEQHAGADRRPNRQPRSHGRRPGTVRAGRRRLVRHNGRIGRGGAIRGLAASSERNPTWSCIRRTQVWSTSVSSPAPRTSRACIRRCRNGFGR